jgi:hypothetical protein
MRSHFLSPAEIGSIIPMVKSEIFAEKNTAWIVMEKS